MEMCNIVTFVNMIIYLH